jgi:murein DD-endopeptidase MepM/ murein hydrolase activator NlpD
LALATNLSISDAYLMDGSGQRQESALIGEFVGIRFDFRTEDLPANSTYTVAVTIDGVTKTRDMAFGAGQPAGGWWNGISGWIVLDRQYDVTVRLDSQNVVAESNESDNTMSFSFTPIQPDPGFKMVFPVPLEHSKEFTIGGYVDVNNESGVFNDYAGGRLAYDGHEGIDITPASLDQAEAGIPIVAAAAGTITWANDGYSDFGNDGGANRISIDHGNGWTTHYGHLRRDSVRVSVGDHVLAGEQIAWLGGSGNGVIHLHFEMKRDGRDVDPNPSADVFWESPLEYSGDAKNVLFIKPTNYAYWDAHDQEASSSFSQVNRFTQGSPETPKFYARITGIKPEDEIYWRFYRPNSQLYASWRTGVTGLPVTWPHTYRLFTPVMPALPDLGDWRIVMEVNGTEMAESFITYTADTFAKIRIEDSNGLYLNPRRFRPIIVENSQSFVAHNHGTGVLTISDLVVPEGFQLISAPDASVQPGQSTTFEVAPDSSVTGHSSGYVEVRSSDPDVPAYRFAIEKTPEPATDALFIGIEQRLFPELATFSANVRRTGDLNSPLTVNLVASDQTRVNLPTTIEFAAGERYKRFDVETLPDVQIQQDTRVSISAAGLGYLPARTEFDLFDTPFLRIHALNSEVTEGTAGGEIEFQVTRGGDPLDSPLAIQLSGTQSPDFDFPESIVIAAGESSTRFAATLADNQIVDGNRTITISASSKTIPVSSSATVTIVDDDVAGLIVSENGTNIQVAEAGESGRFALSLSAQPASDVIVTLATESTAQLSVGTSEVVFSPENWDVAQWISVSAIDDPFVDGVETAQVTASVDGNRSDAQFRGLTETVNVEIIDDELGEFIVSETNDSTIVLESGGSDVFSVTLSARPRGAVVIDVMPDPSADVETDLNRLTFTADNWDVPQSVAVTGIDDQIVNGTRATRITLEINAALSVAPFHNAVARSINVVIIDNDVPRLQLKVSKGFLSENGDSATAFVSQNAILTEPLLVNLASSDPREASVIGSVTIEAGQFESASFPIDSVDDAILDGPQGVTITASAVGYPSAQAQITVTDDEIDNPPTITTPSSVLAVENQILAIDVDATDPQGDQLLYSIVGGVDQQFLTVDPSTGLVAFREAPDFENPKDADRDNRYNVRVAVSNRAGSVTEQSIEITVADDGWSNTRNPFDVDANGLVSILDALIVINVLAIGVDHDPLTERLAQSRPLQVPFYDVNHDERITVLDALQVINRLAILQSQPPTPFEGFQIAKRSTEGHAGTTMETPPGWGLNVPMSDEDEESATLDALAFDLFTIQS